LGGIALKRLIVSCLVLITNIIAIYNLNAAECFYVPKPTPENPNPELSPQGQCGQLNGPDIFQLKKGYLAKLNFSENGLATIRYADAIFYVATSGKTVRTYTYDNGADYFAEGLARTIANGKYGYINEQLKVVIKPEYDFVFPFHNGAAMVCNECKSEQVGEHFVLVGGKWGLINKTGKVIIPVKFKQSELQESAKYKRLMLDTTDKK